jgi:uncharacterized protein (DUF427 family)
VASDRWRRSLEVTMVENHKGSFARNHPITIERNLSRVVVHIGGRVIADTEEALTLNEAGLRPVQYIPRADVDMTLLLRSGQAAHWPHKGEAAYFSVPVGGPRSTNAAWSFEAPLPAIAVIKDYIAFFPDRTDCVDEWERRPSAPGARQRSA